MITQRDIGIVITTIILYLTGWFILTVTLTACSNTYYHHADSTNGRTLTYQRGSLFETASQDRITLTTDNDHFLITTQTNDKDQTTIAGLWISAQAAKDITTQVLNKLDK